MPAAADRDTVFTAIDDLVLDFLVNLRRKDVDLPLGVIEKLLDDEEISVDEIVDKFRDSLEEALEDRVSEQAAEDDDDEDSDEDEDDSGDEDEDDD